ncbi:MAG: hypothetical protein Q9222_001580 [Ikaeria aurantiellina]
MEDLLKEILKDLDVEIVEMKLLVNKPVRLLLHVRPDGTVSSAPVQHYVFKITLAKQESWALDLTGAQHGWYDTPMTPWSIFVEEQLDRTLNIRDLGAMTQGKIAKSRRAGPGKITSTDIMGSLKDSFKNSNTNWQRKNVSFGDMLRCSEENFKSYQSQLVDSMESCVSKERGKINKKLTKAGWILSMGTSVGRY